MKLYSNLFKITLPAICDPVIVGILLNIIGIIIGSTLTKVSKEEIAARSNLFVMPDEEKKSEEMKKTLQYMKFAPMLGVVVSMILIVVWAIPYMIIK